MENLKNIIKDTRKTAVIGLVASIILLIMVYISTRIYALWSRIIYILTPLALTIYYSNVCLKLYKNKGNVIMARNIMFLLYILREYFRLYNNKNIWRSLCKR